MAGVQFGQSDSDELTQTQMQIDHQTNQTLETTRNLRRLAEETREMGSGTLVELNHQGDQLRRINGNLNSIDSNMKSTEKTLTQMEKWFGLFTVPWRRKKKFEKSDEGYSTAYKHTDLVDRDTSRSITGYAPLLPSMRKPHEHRPDPSSTQFINRVTHCGREDEMEENMQATQAAIADIHHMALALGNQLDEQKEMVEQISDKTSAQSRRLKVATTRTDKLTSAWS
eukprot:m.44341 g.44341  ORF g.44341 m.44341 type:complete len:226 (+) comp8521_c0_seq1:131-808(+)